MYCWNKAKLKGLVWSLLCSSIVFILCRIDYVYAIRKGRLMIPSSYTALSGDLYVQLQYNNEAVTSTFDDDFDELSLQISRLRNNDKEKLDAINLHPDPRLNVSQIKLPCQIFFRGGIYELDVVTSSSSSSTSNSSNNSTNNSKNSTAKDKWDERLRQQLDVRWPTPKLSITPELIGTYPEGPVDVILSFPEVECEIQNLSDTEIPEFWLELIYCGQEDLCTSSTITSNGTTKSHVLYAEQIRGFPKTRLIKLRCELFGLAGHYAVQLRPLQPTPSFVSAISYIRADWNEKFVFNVHARSIFPCDPHTGIGVLFEYPACILDQADRVRLFAKLRADVASLKPPTSLHYVTEQRVMRGQHSLHFDCDFFSEKYVEYCFVYVSQAISGAVADIRMDCVPTLPVSDADTGGWGPWSEWTPCSTTCSGGTRNRYRFCDSPPPRYGAKFCEGPAVETEHCGKEVSDTWECLYGPGMLLKTNSKTSSTDRNDVITEIGPGCRCGCIVHLGTSKPRRVLASSAQSCPGRSFWLIQADENYRIHLKVDFFRLPCSTQYVKIRDGDSLASNLISENIGSTKINLEPVISTSSQILVEFFSDEIASMDGSCNGGFLAHVYQIENQNITFISSRAITQKPQMGKRITIVHIAAVVFASIIIIISALLGTQYILRYRKYHLTANRGEPDSPIHTPRASLGSLQNSGGSPPSRAMSTTTLLSEVIYLVKIRPRGRMKHSILRESVDAEALVKETGLNDDEVEKLKCVDSESIGSVHTLTNETVNDGNSNIIEQEASSCSPPNDSESIHSRQSVRSINCTAAATSFIDTPIPRRKLRTDKSNRYSTDTVKSSLLNDVKEDDTETDTDSLKLSRGGGGGGIKIGKRFLSVSNTTLTNGCYSPAASIISTATIRTTNQKESKEKQNRQKLLARPDSEFSLANPEDFELDYYDYNVVNAGAAPGSYLGMDPAYLVWIPPLDDGNILSEIENGVEPDYEEILPNYKDLDPGSNTETPENEAPELPPMNVKRQTISATATENNDNTKNNSILQKTLVAAFLKEDTPPKLHSRRSSISSDKSSGRQSSTDNIQLTELSGKIKKFSPKMHARKGNDIEKETAVVKSPSDLQEYYELDDIQFADEDDSNESDNSKSKTIRYNPGYQVKI